MAPRGLLEHVPCQRVNSGYRLPLPVSWPYKRLGSARFLASHVRSASEARGLALFGHSPGCCRAVENLQQLGVENVFIAF